MKIQLLLPLLCALVLATPSARAGWQWSNDLMEADVSPATYKATFTFRNTGKEDLVPDQVKGCCNCTTFSFTAKSARPGEEGTLSITIDRAKSKSSKRDFSFLVSGPHANPASLEIVVPEDK